MPDYLAIKTHYKLDLPYEKFLERRFSKRQLDSLVEITNQIEENLTCVNSRLKENGGNEKGWNYNKHPRVRKSVNGHYVFLSSKPFNGIDLIFEEKEDGRYGVTDVCYEFIREVVVHPKEEFERIKRKIHNRETLDARELSLLSMFNVV